VAVASYIPPKSEPEGAGRNPTAVMIAKSTIEKRLIDLFLWGFQKISAIRTSSAETISNSSCRIKEKLYKLIFS
jgi:hypothetical protein